MVGFQPIFDGWNPTPPPSVILVTLRPMVPVLWYFWRQNMHAMTQGTISYMRTCGYFLTRIQTSNDESYRNKLGTDHQCTNQLGAYIASLTKLGKIYHKVLDMRNWPLNSSVEVQLTICRGTTAWNMYKFIYPIL